VKSACCWGSDDGVEVCCGLCRIGMVWLAREWWVEGYRPGFGLTDPCSACGTPSLCAEPQRAIPRGMVNGSRGAHALSGSVQHRRAGRPQNNRMPRLQVRRDRAR
jgi:hypothetical protein